MSAAEIFDRHNRPLLELIAAAREHDWPEVANVAALLHTKLMMRRQGGDPYASVSIREVPPRLRVEIHDGFLEIVAGNDEGVAVRYEELPELLTVLEDICADLAGHS